MRWWEPLLDALLPSACAGCGVRSEETLCASCDARLPRIAGDACPRCQLHRTTSAGRCPAAPSGDPLDAAIAAVWLEPPVSAWIHAFKYPRRGMLGLAPGPAAAVADLAARAARHAPGPAPQLVVPVPLHARRLRARGFNPALLVARAIAHSVRAQLDPTALVRVRDTPSQTGLDAAARRRNLRGALHARRRMPACVWLADDVITTGATTREAARALREAGAQRVVAVAAARTPWEG